MPIRSRAPLRPAFCIYLFLMVCLLASAEDAGTTTNTTSVPTTTLSNGVTIPLIGLGCASGVRYNHVLSALNAGYRYLDTAQAHQWGYHEEEVAAALAASPVPRKDVFVTTKIHPENLGYKATLLAVKRSLAMDGFDGYLNAVLIHKPRCWEGACNKVPEGTWQESWKALEELYLDKKVGAIGICDVDDGLLDELLQQSVPPHVIQNWFDPFHQTPGIRQRVQDAGILFQAYSTLGTQWKYQGRSENPVFTNPTLLQLADKHGTTSAAPIVLQWATRKKISVLPASTNAQRQGYNLHASLDFTLEEDDIRAIDALDGKAPPPSRPNPNEISVTFVNPSDDMTVDILWLDDAGNEVPIGVLKAKEDTKMTSYHGHSFVFRDKDSGSFLLQHEMDRANGRKQNILVVQDEEEEEL